MFNSILRFAFGVAVAGVFGFLIACSDGRQDTITTEKDTLRFNPELPEKPNILWLVSEDLSPIIPPFGDSTIQTPNLSRLAAEGVRYTNVYSPSGVCAPSRFALATGMYPSSLGAHNMRTQYVQAHVEAIGLILYEVVPPPEVRMMSGIMRRNGYYCTNNDKTDYQFAPPATAWDESSMYAHWRNRPEGKPFFSIFNFGITHESQLFGPPSIRNLRYDEDFPDRSREFPRGVNLDSSEWEWNVPKDLEVPVPPYLPDNEVVRNDVRLVYSNIIEMDRQVGLILDQLEEDGLLDSTIIVWYTDHGGPLPRQKRLIYDSGIKVPMIIRYPGKQGAGKVDDQLISFIDFAPTTFSFCNIKPPDYLEGQAFAGKYRAEEPRDYIHAAADRLDKHYDMIRAVRDKRFKYLRNFKQDQGYYLPVQYRERMNSMKELLRMRDEGTLNEVQAQWFRESKPGEELFDTWRDPHEVNNIAGEPEYQDKLKELRQECIRWMEEIDDKGFIPEEELIDRFWPDWEQPVTRDPEIQVQNNTVSISCETEGASIGYQVLAAGEDPGNSWQVYTGPFDVPKKSELLVVAHRLGFEPSNRVKTTLSQ